MNRIYSIINERSGGKYARIRFGEVSFFGGAATVKVVCESGMLDSVRADAELKRLISEVCAFNCKLRIDISEEEVSARAIRDAASNFARKFPFVSAVAGDIRASVDPCTVYIKMHSGMYELAKTDFIPRLDEYLKNNFIAPINIEVDTRGYSEMKSEKQREIKTYEISELTPVIGETDAKTALSAGGLTENAENIAVCGILTMPTEFVSKGAGAKRSRPYTRFLLYDGENTLQCRSFAHTDTPLFESGVTNMPVCAVGNAAFERGRIEEISLTVNALSLCRADGLNVIKPRPAPASYSAVRPAPYEEYVQASLFGHDEAMPESLAGTFVAFDFETTGLSIKYDTPTELGAVKIVDGVITETFSTLIDPRRPIPDDVSKKTGITDDMVRGKPLFEEILPDFYKFTYGCALVGHNIGFDFPFLIKHGNRIGWAFGDRRTFDTMGMAPVVFPGIEYLTLEYVLERLGLVNDSAHRALSDATATAKAFVAMNKLLAKRS